MTSTARRYEIIAIGASAGGFDAICRIVSVLPADFDIPVALIQHRAKDSRALAELLQDCAAVRVIEVDDKQPVEPRCCYVAPPDYHLLIDDGAFSLSTEGPVGYSRPSIDVFFESAADAYGPGVIGVVLTGANTDGAKGLRNIVARGGHAIVQDPATAEVKVMPEGARKLVRHARVLPLDQIGSYLIGLDVLQKQQLSRQS